MLSYNDGHFGVGVLKDNNWNYYTIFFCAASNGDCPGVCVGGGWVGGWGGGRGWGWGGGCMTWAGCVQLVRLAWHTSSAVHTHNPS